jgi:hypothetical protein
MAELEVLELDNYFILCSSSGDMGHHQPTTLLFQNQVRLHLLTTLAL